MITLTTLTRPLIIAAEKINRTACAIDDYPDHLEAFRDADEALYAAAAQRNLDTPFTDGGEIRSELDGDPVNWYRQAEKELEAAQRDRDTLLKGAAVTAGAATGGLLTREAIRRGWITGALRKANKRLFPAIIAKRYGEVAGAAARLAMGAGQIRTVVQAALTEDDEDKKWAGRVHLTGVGLVLEVAGQLADTGKPVKIGIPFEAVEGIEQKTYFCHRDGSGRADEIIKATLYISGHIPLNIPR